MATPANVVGVRQITFCELAYHEQYPSRLSSGEQPKAVDYIDDFYLRAPATLLHEIIHGKYVPPGYFASIADIRACPFSRE